MKKLISLLLVIVLICSALAGCGHNEVTDESKLAVIEDYLIWSGIQSDKTPDEIECEFFGQYGESIAVYFHTSGAYETPTTEQIEEYKFKYPDSRVIRIWNNGKFYKMTEAYDIGLINKSDVLLIKLKSLFLRFQDPYFIYEERVYNTPNFELKTLAYNAVSAILDKSISGYTTNKKIDTRFFGDFEFTEICELWRSDETHQEFLLVFAEQSREGLLNIIDSLYEIDGIKEVKIIYTANLDYLPNDELYKNSEEYIQWALENIKIENVWDFTQGSNSVRVGVMDTGIASHEDLDDNYLLQNAWAFTYEKDNYIKQETKCDNVSHGTHIAGIIEQ